MSRRVWGVVLIVVGVVALWLLKPHAVLDGWTVLAWWVAIATIGVGSFNIVRATLGGDDDEH